MGSTPTIAAAAREEEAACVFAMQLAVASMLPMTVKAAIQLGLLETLVGAGGKTLTATEVAAELPSTANPNAAEMVDRILRLLATHNIVSCHVDEDGVGVRRYGPTPVCKLLTPDADGDSLAPMVLLCTNKVHVESWYYLKDAVLDGILPFEKAHGTSNAYEYTAKNELYGSIFNNAMSSHSSIITKKLLEVYTEGFNGVRTLVDVAGGVGATVHAITTKYPNIRGINLDLPHVISQAPTYAHVTHVAGDMFDKIPSGDVILLKWILHNWTDERCAALLRNCRDALPVGGRVIVLDTVFPATPVATPLAQLACHFDMIMLTNMPNGKERCLTDFQEMAKLAGFHSFRATSVYADIWAIEFTK